MIKLFTTVLLVFLIPYLSNAEKSDFIKGADVSTLAQIEERGGVFKENGVTKDALQIFKDHGFDFIRLRLWHTPADGHCGLQETIEMARRGKSLGFGFLLDFHFSDTWADPAHQTKPAAWSNLSFDTLKDSVLTYTYNVIRQLEAQNALPDIVQLGNEIICGMLWNEGRVCDPYNINRQWQQLAELLNAAKTGILNATGIEDTVKIMIHIDRGGDNGGSRWFFDNLLAQDFEFDLIGLSFYPWWHGTLDDLRTNLNDLSVRYERDIIIAEAAYPWTLQWNDNEHNKIGLEDQLHSGYYATVEGQKNYYADLMQVIRETPQERGTGVVLWEPAWITAPGFGSPWENLTLFDFNGNVLPSISVFDNTATRVTSSELNPSADVVLKSFPNSFNSSTTIQYEIHDVSTVNIQIVDINGRVVKNLRSAHNSPGRYSCLWNGSDESGNRVSTGLYICRLTSKSDNKMVKLMLLQ